MKALILAAGRATNLEPLTATRPAAMLPVCGEPIIGHQLRMLRATGVTQAVVVVGHQSDCLTTFLGNGDAYDMQIQYAYQPEPQGVGDAVARARTLFSPTEHFVLVYGDIISADNIFDTLRSTFTSFRAPVAAVALAQSTVRYGNIYMDQQMRIRRIIEKPEGREMGNYVLAGAYILPAVFFELLELAANDFLDALDRLNQQHALYASIWESEWMDLYRPWDLLAANRMIMDTWTHARISSSVSIEGTGMIQGPAVIDEGVKIASGATIHGPCFIGRGCYIGNNALVRRFSVIGPRSIVGFGVELKNAVMMDGTKVGRLSFIGDSVLGERVEVGAGAMTVNSELDHRRVRVMIDGESIETNMEKLGAMVGDDAQIGAGNILLPGAMIPAKARLPHRGCACVDAAPID